MLIINTPQNPTGMVLDEEKIVAIAELAKKYKFMVLFDDIYDNIIFGDRKHTHMLALPGMLDWCVNLNGYSKNYAMTGVRLGYVIAPTWVIEIFGKLAINKWSCVSRVHQILAGVIFGDMDVDGVHYPSIKEDLKPIIEKDYAEYEKKGQFLEKSLRLAEPYICPNEAEGAFYLFPNINELLGLSYVKNDLGLDNDSKFGHWLLNEKGFAALPGSDFGEGGVGHIRLSYAEDRDNHIIPGTKHLLKIVAELVEKSGKEPAVKAEEVDTQVDAIAKEVFG